MRSFAGVLRCYPEALKKHPPWPVRSRPRRQNPVYYFLPRPISTIRRRKISDLWKYFYKPLIRASFRLAFIVFSLSSPYASVIVPLSFTHRSLILHLSFPYPSPIVPLSFTYRLLILAQSFWFLASNASGQIGTNRDKSGQIGTKQDKSGQIGTARFCTFASLPQARTKSGFESGREQEFFMMRDAGSAEELLRRMSTTPIIISSASDAFHGIQLKTRQTSVVC